MTERPVAGRPMGRWIQAHKPVAPARVQILLAALMWSVVGATLLSVGWMWTAGLKLAWRTLLLGAALAAGAAKSRLILDRAAESIGARIEERGDGRCVGGFLSLRSWALVLVMAGGGRVLRGLFSHPPVGVLYVAIGSALLGSSLVLWQRWRGTR